ncbi:MAG: hypothetical protein K8U03_08615 [Planctomycetia bacterium]|nr:hypothetical protein [Planctomycetia bacterium]
MTKEQDLLLVASSIPTSGLRSLSKALRCRRVIHGRFVDGRGNGCLFYWLSEREMVDRASRIHWTRTNPLFDSAHDEAIRRLIVGWDASTPSAVVKGPGYDTEYPAATYALTEDDIRQGLAATLRLRRAANRAENEAVQRTNRRLSQDTV